VKGPTAETGPEDEARWSFALESAGLGVWDADLVRGRCYYSRVWKAMLGYAEDEIGDDADTWLRFVHPDDRERAIDSGKAHEAGLAPIIETEFRMRHKDGRWIWVLDRGKIIERDEAGRPTRMIGVQTDITGQKRAERQLEIVAKALADEKERLRIMLQSIGEAVICTGIDNCVTFMNEAAEILTQRSGASTLGVPLEQFFRPVGEESGAALEPSTRAAMREGRTIERDGILIRGDGSRRFIRDLASPIVASNGETVGSVLVAQDTTAARALQRDLAHAATHDALTGLKNRSAFEAALAESLADAKKTGKQYALLYVDLDRFKMINDTAGHAAGDSILRNVAGALKGAIASGDIVARLGGDEFAVLLDDCKAGRAEETAAAILALIGAERFQWTGKVHELGASIGIAMIDGDIEGPEAALACADVACYSAKASGRNRWSLFRPDTGEAHRHMSELQLASGIREAIAHERFCLYAQEIRDLRSPLKRGCHLEILTRLIAPDGSIIRPGTFIPAAERFDLMGALDRWVIETALRDHGAMIMAVPGLAVAINLSANSLSDPDLWPFVEAALRKSELDPARLTFEITETAVINNFSASERFVAQARAAGARISVDDFGTGVSSFTYLKRFRVDMIKIDSTFVGDMHESRYDRAIVRLIGEVAQEIGADVIAEGIEATDTVEILQSLGIKYGQGYLFHRPRPLKDVLADYGTRDTAPAALRVAS
jgi:diguanylate cyclase (GGDEF)-like protein/PAS domain S-box-containing protein